MDQQIHELDGLAAEREPAPAGTRKHTSDPIAKTHLCESPCAHSASLTQLSLPASAYLIMVRGGMPGTMLRLSDAGTTLGRSSDCTFQFYDNSVSRRHALVTLDAAGDVRLRDEGSTNGTFVNGKKILPQRRVRLADGDRVVLGTGVVLKLVRLDPHDEQFQREMFERTVRDTLTGLYNRDFFLNQIRSLATRSAEQGIGLAVLMLDVDHFKMVNDRYGHQAGDTVLKEVAAVLRESTRAEDLVARYGGEEFVAALPVSAPDLASERAERIRWNLAARSIAAGSEQIRVTASVGLAFGLPGRARNELALIRTADRALYQAKADGRDRVVFGSHDSPFACGKTDSPEFLPVCS